MKNPILVKISKPINTETDKAITFNTNFKFWTLPKSQIEIVLQAYSRSCLEQNKETVKPDIFVIKMPEWLFVKNLGGGVKHKFERL